MDAERGWQYLLDVVEREIPKVNFNKWVCDTHVISYEEGHFRIGTASQDACEWLESRFARMATRLLVGIMNREVEVEFVVEGLFKEFQGETIIEEQGRTDTVEAPSCIQHSFDTQKEDDVCGSVESGLDGRLAHEVCQTAFSTKDPEIEKRNPSIIVMARPENPSLNFGEENISQQTLEMRKMFEQAYEQIVQPNHVTLVPRYFLRFLPHLGPELGWLYLGFRQAAYNIGARSGIGTGRFSGKAIAVLSGIQERTFWNWISQAATWEKLKGLVATSALPGWNLKSPSPRRLPRLYEVSMTLPLTAADSQSLRHWFWANIDRYREGEKAIEAAIESPLDELLPPGEQPAAGDSPETVSEILHDLFADQVSPEHLQVLQSRLQRHIMPEDDRLAVSHFFVRNILPYLGSGPGWIVTLIRWRGYYDRKNVVVRDTMRIAGGYAEIASWIGVVPRTIWRWIHGKHVSGSTVSYKNNPGGCQAVEAGKWLHPLLHVYLRETKDHRSSGYFETAARNFQVLMDEIPREILESTLDNVVECSINGADNCEYFRNEGIDTCLICRIGMARFTEDHRAICSKELAQFAVTLHALCRVFKLPSSLKPISNTLKPNTWPYQEKTVVETYSLPSEWNLEWFFRINNTSPKIKDRLRFAGATGKALVSWMLYASSIHPAAQKLTDPYAFALSRLMDSPLEGKDPSFDQLASLSPGILTELLEGKAFDQNYARLFERLMGNGRLGQLRYRALLPILTGRKRPLQDR